MKQLTSQQRTWKKHPTKKSFGFFVFFGGKIKVLKKFWFLTTHWVHYLFVCSELYLIIFVLFFLSVLNVFLNFVFCLVNIIHNIHTLINQHLRVSTLIRKQKSILIFLNCHYSGVVFYFLSICVRLNEKSIKTKRKMKKKKIIWKEFIIIILVVSCVSLKEIF